MDGPAAAARSWLFAPGDSARKMEKAVTGDADIVLLDLEDAVAEDEKPDARGRIAAFLSELDEGRARVWVRINPLDSAHALADLAAIVPARPGGLMLPKAGGPADVERLHRYLEAHEAAHGIDIGTTPVAVLATETAEAMFTTGSYRGAPRLAAMSWGAEDLADSVGAASNTDERGAYGPTYELARSLCLLGAAAAGVPAIETIMADFRDEEALRCRCDRVRRDGFSGMLAIHPAQVPVINEAFTPGQEEITTARGIVQAFADNPGKGTVSLDGAMLDRPHLARAQRLLARAGAPRERKQ
jgi:citrate lyase subunit beta/citryl-CoA lyase